MSFLAEPSPSPEVEQLYDDDVAGDGYVMNLTRLWAHQPAAVDDLTAMLSRAAREAGSTLRQRGILITAAASTLGDSHCSLAWGGQARRVARDPNATSAADVQALRDARPAEVSQAVTWGRPVATP